MTDGYEQMGNYFLNLWQQQVTRMSHDPNYLQSMLDMMTRMQQTPPQNSWQPSAYAPQYTSADSPAPASQPVDGTHADLIRRIGELEKRVAFLERGYAALSGSPYLDDGLPPKRGTTP